MYWQRGAWKKSRHISTVFFWFHMILITLKLKVFRKEDIIFFFNKKSHNGTGRLKKLREYRIYLVDAAEKFSRRKSCLQFRIQQWSAIWMNISSVPEKKLTLCTSQTEKFMLLCSSALWTRQGVHRLKCEYLKKRTMKKTLIKLSTWTIKIFNSNISSRWWILYVIILALITHV